MNVSHVLLLIAVVLAIGFWRMEVALCRVADQLKEISQHIQMSEEEKTEDFHESRSIKP